MSAASLSQVPPGSLPSCPVPLSPHGAPGCQDCPRDKQKGGGSLALAGAHRPRAGHPLTHLLSSLARDAGHAAGPWHRLSRGASLPLQRTHAQDLAGGSGAPLLSSAAMDVLLSPSPQRRDTCAGGDGDRNGSSPAPGQAGSQPLRLPFPGQGDTREDPKAGELAGQGLS